MRVFQYRARRADGTSQVGVVRAEDAEAARASLLASGLEVLGLTLVPDPGRGAPHPGTRLDAPKPEAGPPPGRTASRPATVTSPVHRAETPPEKPADALPSRPAPEAGRAPRVGTGSPRARESGRSQDGPPPEPPGRSPRRPRAWSGWGRTLKNALAARHVSSVRVAATFSQLEVMLHAGIQVVPALAAITRQQDLPAYRDLLEQVTTAVSRGQTLSSALGAHPRVFPPFALAMMRNGEMTGRLEAACHDITVVLEREAALRQRISRAVWYPAFVVSLAAFLGFALFRWVLPGLMGSLTGPQTPWIGRAVALGVQVAHQPILLGLAAAVAILGFWQARVFLSTEAGREGLEKLLLRFPLTARLTSQVAQVRLARCLAAQLRAGVMILPALRLTSEMCGSAIWRRILGSVADHLKNGAPLAVSLQAQQAPHSRILLNLVRAGEESGDLDGMLERAASMLESDVETLLETLVHLLEPALIATAGLVTVLVLVGVFGALQQNLQFP